MFHLGWNTVEQFLQRQQPLTPDNRLKELAASESFVTVMPSSLRRRKKIGCIP